MTAICQVLDEPESHGVMVRVGMTNPPYMVSQLDTIVLISVPSI